jgi:hypothetical protein
MKRLFFVMLVGAMSLLVSCNAHRHTLQAHYQTKCEYINDEGDGSITLRAYGEGRYRKDAIEQARKNAVRTIIFEGVNVLGNQQLSRPLIFENNAEEKYEDFFYAFFKDEGDYAQFVDHSDRRILTNERHWDNAQVKISTTVRVYRSELKQYLKEQNIIK